MRIGKWKKSQSSNGYYCKTSGNVPVFIRFESKESTPFKYQIIIRKGLDGVPYPIREESTMNNAKKWMINYMKNHPYGW